MRRRVLDIFVIAACAVALSNCYGTKMVKGPINSERAAMSADTIRVEQRRIQAQLDRIEQQMAKDSEERAAFQGQATVTMAELEEAVRVLVSRIEDSEQLMINRGGRDRASGSRPAAGQGPDSTAAAGEEIYRNAYLDVTRGNYELAAQAFQDYLTQFPQGPRVAEARYYLGECDFATERYLEAAGDYQRVVQDFPASRLVPAAYLKMGHAYQHLEERTLAQKAYQTLIDKYPTTEEAKQARAALKDFGG